MQNALPPAELKLSRTLLAHYPLAGLESSHALAARAGVSAPTVLRFLARLGLKRYSDFQDALRLEVQARRASPLTLAGRITASSPTTELSAMVADTAVETIRRTFGALPEHEFDSAIDLLCDTRLRITSFGGRFSRVLAAYFDSHLRLMRPGTRVQEVNPHVDPIFLTDLSRWDVCVVLDFRRYQQDTITLSRRVKERGAKVLLVTDPWLSPVADVADVVLSADVEAAGSFDSLVAATALIEALVAGVHARLGDTAEQRMRGIESLLSSTTAD